MVRRALSLRFLAAIFVSVLVHAVVISGAWLRPPEKSPAAPRLEARLEYRVPPPAPPVSQPTARPKPVAPRPAQPPPLALPPVTAATPFALPSEPEPPALPSEPELPAPVAEEPESEPLAAEPSLVASVPSSTFAPEPAPLKSLPKKGRITYTLFFGADRFPVGRTVQTWEIEGDGYRLGSVSETTGIVELFRAQRLVYLSQGKLTARGLQPENFLMSRTRRGQTEAAQARFDWEAGTITLGKVPNQHGVALSVGSQDIVSFMYQLSLAPPAAGRIRLPITNGSRIESYELEVLNEKEIETPLGMLKTLPLKQVRRPGAESIEIWLAVEYRHLPVKLRFYDREGNPSAEQVVNEIRISEE